MNEKTAQWVAVVVGVALIVIYSVVMMATEGSWGWSWILLVAGIGSLLGRARLFRRGATRQGLPASVISGRAMVARRASGPWWYAPALATMIGAITLICLALIAAWGTAISSLGDERFVPGYAVLALTTLTPNALPPWACCLRQPHTPTYAPAPAQRLRPLQATEGAPRRGLPHVETHRKGQDTRLVVLDHTGGTNGARRSCGSPSTIARTCASTGTSSRRACNRPACRRRRPLAMRSSRFGRAMPGSIQCRRRLRGADARASSVNSARPHRHVVVPAGPRCPGLGLGECGGDERFLAVVVVIDVAAGEPGRDDQVAGPSVGVVS